jgi:hypothetical protein
MKRVSMPCSIVMTLALAALPAALRAQSENLLATKTINTPANALNASFEAIETQWGKKLVPESQPMLQLGNLRASAQVALKSWNVSSILTNTPRSNWKSWTIAGFGSRLPGAAIQPYAAAGPAAVKPWSALRIPTETPHPNLKSWTIAAPGSLPLAVAIQPDATQKYGTNPAILEVHFGHRP